MCAGAAYPGVHSPGAEGVGTQEATAAVDRLDKEIWEFIDSHEQKVQELSLKQG